MSVAPGTAARSCSTLQGAPHPEPLIIVGNFLSHLVGKRSVCEDLADRLEQRGWPVTRTSHHANRLARLGGMLVTCLSHGRACSVAQVETYSGNAFLLAEAAAAALHLHNTPFIATLHGGNLPAFAQSHPRRVRRLLQSAAAVTSPSPYLQKALVPFRDDIQIIPNALDIIHHTFRLRANPTPSLMWLRAFHSIYNPSMAIRVLAALRPQFPAARLTMVGPDKGDGSLQAAQALAASLRLDSAVDFILGVPKSDVPATLQSADIFINTTNIDNTPVTVLEAMAGGLCVVTTDPGGIPDLVCHEHDALIVPTADPQPMTAAVTRLLAEPDLASRLSVNGRTTAEACDWSRVLPMWEDLFTRIARPRVRS